MKLVICGLVLIVFGITLSAPFQFDDHSLFAGASVWLPLQTRPLTYATFWLNRALGGENPIGFHLVNLIAHGVASLLLLSTLSLLIPPRAAFLAAIIFAVHPLQVEPVAYIFARSSMLATMFCLASLHAWLRDKHWVAAVLFVLALLSKEECAAFPVAIAALDYLIRKKPLRAGPIAAMLAAAFGAVAWVAAATIATPGSGAGSQAGIAPLDYFFSQGTVLLRYARLLVFPTGLSIDPQIAHASPAVGLACWIVIAIAAAATFRLEAGKWFAIGLILILPTSSFFPAADLAVDRRLYLPMIALSSAAGLIINSLRSKWVVPALAIAMAAVSLVRVQVWRTEKNLWADAAAKAPEKVRPKLWLLKLSGEAPTQQEAADLRRLAPDDPVVASELGKALLTAGRNNEALSEFGRAVALSPHDATAYNNRGAAYLALGLKEPAVESLIKALEIDPCLTSALENLSRAGVDVTSRSTQRCAQ